MNDRVKISVACFTGAAVCVLTALAVAPAFWWLGMLTGFATGYLAYEFRSVVRESPGAAREAWTHAPAAARRFASFLKEEVFVKAPFFHAAVVMAVFSAAAFPTGNLKSMFPILILRSIVWFCTSVMLWIVYRFLAAFGSALVERTGWKLESEEDGPQHMFREIEMRRTVDITYFRALRWAIEGVLAAPVVAVGAVLTVCGFFCWLLLKKVHSDKRVICGFDSALGGSIAWLTMGSHGVPAALSVACGGLIGAALGLVSYELVFKRLHATRDL